MIPQLFLQGLYAFIACAAFAVTFNTPKKELWVCGACGSLSRIASSIILSTTNQTILATLFASILITFVARFLSYIRKAPSTMYHISGILPLVPGMALFRTLSALLEDDLLQAMREGLLTLKIGGVIGIGSILVFALPYAAFEWIRLKEAK